MVRFKLQLEPTRQQMVCNDVSSYMDIVIGQSTRNLIKNRLESHKQHS